MMMIGKRWKWRLDIWHEEEEVDGDVKGGFCLSSKR
jgi:hypothetical protein